MHKKMYLWFGLFIVSLWLIEPTLTGNIISETCCFPPNCNPESMCSFEEQPKTYFGLVILVGSIILMYATTHEKDIHFSFQKKKKQSQVN